jgi:hypothetical protein
LRDLKQTIVQGVSQIGGNASVDQLAQTENRELLDLIKLRGTNGSAARASNKASTTKKIAEANGYSSERIFFLDASGGRIESLNPDGSDRRVIVEDLKRLPDGIDVDAQAGHVYWTNMGNPTMPDGSIERADIDGTNRNRTAL